MKKGIFIFVFCILVNTSIAYGQEQAIRDYGKFIEFDGYWVYCLSLEGMEEFVNEPSFENLSAIDYKTERMRYLRNDDPVSVYLDANVMVSSDFYNEENLKYVSCENLDKVLKENNIDDKVNTVAMLEYSWCDGDYCPFVVWINTQKNENYFLVYDEKPNWLTKEEENVKFSRFEDLELITYKEFKNRYEKKRGELYIDGDLVENTVAPIFQGYTYRIPIRGLLEGLGYEVSWDGDNQVVLATKNGHTKALIRYNNEEFQARGRICNYPEDYEQIMLNNTFYNNINGNLYISGRFLGEILGALDEKYMDYNSFDFDVDFENQRVLILTK